MILQPWRRRCSRTECAALLPKLATIALVERQIAAATHPSGSAPVLPRSSCRPRPSRVARGARAAPDHMPLPRGNHGQNVGMAWEGGGVPADRAAKRDDLDMPPAGFEPTAPGLGILCSFQTWVRATRRYHIKHGPLVDPILGSLTQGPAAGRRRNS